MKCCLLLVLLLISIIPSIAGAKDCGANEVAVKAHTRTLNRKLVKVKASCRQLDRLESQWWQKIKTRTNQIPLVEESVNSKQKVTIIEVLRSLPAWSKKIGINTIEIDDKAASSSVNLITQTITLQKDILRDPKSLKRVLVHEYAHLLFASLDPRRKDKFLNAAGWLPIDGKWLLFSREPVEIADSRESPDEHFSNMIEIYETDRQGIKTKNPRINTALEDILNE